VREPTQTIDENEQVLSREAEELVYGTQFSSSGMESSGIEAVRCAATSGGQCAPSAPSVSILKNRSTTYDGIDRVHARARARCGRGTVRYRGVESMCAHLADPITW
jgi:hypothetical protein